MSPAQQNARDFVEGDARPDGLNAAASRCGGAAIPVEGRKGYSDSDFDCAPRESALVDGIDRLAGAASGSLDVSDVAKALHRTFKHIDREGFGELYVAGAADQPLFTELFVLPDREFRLAIARVGDQKVADWRSRLIEKGWADAGTIPHPFVQDAFYKDGKQIRLEHNMDTIQSIQVLGLNVSKTP